MIPPYLTQPAAEAPYYYGNLRYDPGKKNWIIEGQPCVVQLAKRLFPGCDGRGQGMARFRADRRVNGDLNWLMLRYPLCIEEQDRWERAIADTVAYVEKRDKLLASPVRSVPGPSFQGTLRPFQEEGLGYLLHNRRTLLADEMGLGKTVQALAFLAETQAYPALLVVPPHLVLNWKKEIGRFLYLPVLPGQLSIPELDTGINSVHVIKGLKPYNLEPANIYIIHYLILRGWKDYLPNFGFKAVIMDEIQELRHRQTEKYSAASLLSDACDNVMGLSGTPIYNRGGEMWNVMNIIEFQCLGDWEGFSREWCNGYGSDVVKKPELLGDYLKREGLLLRRTKDQVLTELPPKRRVVQTVDYDTGLYGELIQKAIERAMAYDSIKDFTEKGHAKQEIERETRQATGIAKAHHVAMFVRMLLEAGEKVLLFGYHHAVYDIWMEELKEFKPVKITGRETAYQKNLAEQAFMSGRTPICIISLRAAAGLNLQAARCVVFGELDWSPAVHAQGEDRVHRMGQLDSVLAYYLVCEGGMDEAIQEALGLKVSQFAGIMGDQTESEGDRMLAQAAASRHMDQVIERLKAAGLAKGA